MQNLFSNLTPSEEPSMTGEDSESPANLQSPSVRTDLTTTFRRLKASFGRETGSQDTQQETLPEATGTTDTDHSGMDNSDSIRGLNFLIDSGFTDHVAFIWPVINDEISKARCDLTQHYKLFFQDIHPTKSKVRSSIRDFFTAYDNWVPKMLSLDETRNTFEKRGEWGRFCFAAQSAAKAVKSIDDLSLELRLLESAPEGDVANGLWPMQR